MRASTTTSLSLSSSTAVYGQSVTFTATVSPVAPGSGTPTGTVTIDDSSTTLGTASLTAGKTTFSTTKLATGQHAITAVYNGNSILASSTSATLNQTVKPPRRPRTTASVPGLRTTHVPTPGGIQTRAWPKFRAAGPGR